MEVPEDQDVIVHYFWPSGAKLELQIYFKKGENAKHVLEILFESEGICPAILPDVMNILKDLFFYERRNPELPSVLPECFQETPAVKTPWIKYSKLLSTQYLKDQEHNLQKALELSTQQRSQKLIEHQTPQEISKIEEEFIQEQTQLKNQFWKKIQEAPQTTLETVSFNQNLGPQIFKQLKVSFGGQAKRKFRICVSETQDMCQVPLTQPQENQSYLTHPSNVYKTHISVLLLPFDDSLNILPELIRKSEEKPELHFDPIRVQAQQFTETDKQSICFTRHSNIQGIEGAFHLPVNKEALLKEVVLYANSNGVSQVFVPLAEWTETKDLTEFTKLIKSSLIQVPPGDLSTVHFLLEETPEEFTEILYKVFAEAIVKVT